MNLQELVRKNIWNLKAYSSARNEFKGEASVFLDANENPWHSPFNRYPDPLQQKLKDKIGKIKGVDSANIFLGNGSDEPIDLVIRIFCEPCTNNIVAIDPTYGMYQVCADINDVEYRKILLNNDYSLDADRLLAATDKNTKLIFLCSPNNPTSNILNKQEVEKIISSFNGIVVLDEAYIDFSAKDSFLPNLGKYPNLIILQTFSKAWGLAAIRLGMAFASADIIGFFNKVKYPYNINQLTQNYMLKELDNLERTNEWITETLAQRHMLASELKNIPTIERVYESDANFLLIRVGDPISVYNFLVDQGIIVRNRNTIALCNGCLRITIGSDSENKTLLEALSKYES